ncbi:twitching motility protein PilT [Achromatium sp. WMS3]|nr:twitching motility protein PilT [Achromatium sp. WMS3]
MRIFFDSSALAKRYILESGGAQVLEWCQKADELAIAAIAVPEIISAFCCLQREQRINATQYQQLKRELLADIIDAMVCEITPQVINYAVQALETHTRRGMDALHVGAALACSVDIFISADVRQGNAAQHLGLKTISL